MLDLNDPNLIYVALAVLVGILVGFLLWRASRRPEVPVERRDHLAEHQVPTQGTFARVSQGPLPPAQPGTSVEAAEPVAQPRHDPVPPRGGMTDDPPPVRGATRVDVYDDPEPAQPVTDAPEASMGAGHDGSEPNDIAQEAAAAATDVVGQLLGINAHGALAAGEDNLQTMKGVGPKLAAILRAEGLTRFADIAALTPDQIGALDAKLGAFKGRLARDRVVEQAGYLARADREGYERAFGKL